MLNPFLLKLLLSFIVGAAWITLATVVAEKLGTKAGGILAGLPSTSAISLFFIAWTQNTLAAVEATTITPLIMALDLLFILGYVSLLRFRFSLALGLPLACLSLAFVASVLFPLEYFWLNMMIYVIAFFAGYWLLEHKLKIASQGKKQMQYKAGDFVFRIALSGGMIAFAVVMAKVLGPIAGGVFSMFPAVMLSSIIISYRSHGASFSAAMMKAIYISSWTPIIYSVVVRYTYGSLGLGYGTLLSFVISFGAGYLIYRYTERRMK